MLATLVQFESIAQYVYWKLSEIAQRTISGEGDTWIVSMLTFLKKVL
jgi:hypothetical protein